MCDAKRLLGSTSWPGAFAEFVIAPEDTVYHLDSSLNYFHGTLVEPLAVGVHAVRQGLVTSGDRVAVLGAGPIGIELAALLKRAGADYIHLEARQIGHTIAQWPREVR